jgi:hypothetical protein
MRRPSMGIVLGAAREDRWMGKWNCRQKQAEGRSLRPVSDPKLDQGRDFSGACLRQSEAAGGLASSEPAGPALPQAAESVAGDVPPFAGAAHRCL